MTDVLSPESGLVESPPDDEREGEERRLDLGYLPGVSLALVGILLSVSLWSRLFASPGITTPAVLGIALGAFVGLVTGRRGWSALAGGLLLSLALLVGTAVWAAGDVASAPGQPFTSWKRLATDGLLVPSGPQHGLPVVMTLAASSFWASLAIRRDASPGSAAVPTVLASVVALAYSAGVGQPGLGYGLLLAGCVLGLFLASAQRHRRELLGGTSDRRSLLTALGYLMAGAVGATALTGLASSPSDSFDLRQRLMRPIELLDEATPLASVRRGLVSEEPQRVFTLTVDGLGDDQEIEYVPVAMLDVFDGTVWRSGGALEPMGAEVPIPRHAANEYGAPVRQTIAFSDGYPFSHLPLVGPLQRTETRGLVWDPVSGAVASSEEFEGTVEAEVTPHLLGARPDVASAPGADLSYASLLPPLSEGQAAALVAYIGSATEAGMSPLERLEAVEADLRSDRFGYNIEVSSGHSLPILTCFLGECDSNGPSRIGFSEQAATSFALVARQLGFPSRVVVGYRLDEPITAGSPERGVLANEVHAWPEVWFAETGWTRFEPTNKDNQTSDLPERAPAVDVPDALEELQDDIPLDDLIPELPDEPVVEGTPWWLLALGVPLLGIVGTPVLKGFRRRRRAGSADNDRRVVGAWHEVRDRFGDYGLPNGHELSPLALSDRLIEIDLTDVADPVLVIGPPLDEALYGPKPVDESTADEAWAAANHAIRAARAEAGVGTRLRAAIDPRTIFSRH